MITIVAIAQKNYESINFKPSSELEFALARIINELVGQASSLSVGQDRQDAYPTFHARE
jgi:hypothetical protein